MSGEVHNKSEDHQDCDCKLTCVLHSTPATGDRPMADSVSAEQCADPNCVDGYVPRQPDGEPEPCRLCHPEQVDPLLDRLWHALVAGCNCLTKTPDPQYHKPLCHYRLHYEAHNEISMLRTTLKEWETKGAGLTSEDLDTLRQVLR